MSAVTELLAMPAVPAIMTAVLASPSGVEEASIVTGGGSENLENALAALARHGFVTRRSGRVFLPPGGDALDKARKVIAVFEELKSFAEISFMVRGVLGATEYFECLVHRQTLISLITGEDVGREMLESVLAAEQKQGYIEELDIAYHTRGNLREKFFPYIPRHHYEDFVFMHSRAAGAATDEADSRLVLERYLFSRHPASLAEQARQYMREKKPHILDRVRNEAFDIIWWFDRY